MHGIKSSFSEHYLNLTTQNDQAYSLSTVSNNAVGIGLLRKAANSRNVVSSAVFLRLVSPSMGGLGGEPQGSPVRFPGSPTRPVPPTRLDSGVRLNQLNDERERNMTNSHPKSVPTVFNFNSTEIRTTNINGQVYFKAADVTKALGFGNSRQALSTHVDKDDVQKLDTIDKLGRTQLVTHVTESGMYALIFGSIKPEAKQFKKWVTSEVLPSIRQTGGFSKSEETNQLKALKVIEERLDAKFLALNQVEASLERNLSFLPERKSCKYLYPLDSAIPPERYRMEDSGFLNIAALLDETWKKPLDSLLNQLVIEGHDVHGAVVEYQAMRHLLHALNGVMKSVNQASTYFTVAGVHVKREGK